MTKIYNVSKMKERRRLLRQTQTKTENTLWQRLRDRRLNNLKFRRQFSVAGYIVDFFCPEMKLVVEIDGAHHFTNIGQEYDAQRTETLNSVGLKVLRFTVTQIKNDVQNVLEEISKLSHSALPPSPYQGEGRGEVEKEAVV